MPIYRVTFQTQLLVHCDDERDAERIGYHHLVDEVRNGTSDVHRVERIETEDQLRRGERGTLPWRDECGDFTDCHVLVEDCIP